MKKKLTTILSFAFAATLALALVGCGGGESESTDSSTDSGNTVAMTENEKINKEVCDDETCTIAVLQAVEDEEGDAGYVIECTNNTDQVIYVCSMESYVGGAEAYMDGADVVQPGETREIYLYFYADEIGGGIEALVDVDFTIDVWVDAETPTELLATYTVSL